MKQGAKQNPKDAGRIYENSEESRRSRIHSLDYSMSRLNSAFLSLFSGDKFRMYSISGAGVLFLFFSVLFFVRLIDHRPVTSSQLDTEISFVFIFFSVGLVMSLPAMTGIYLFVRGLHAKESMRNDPQFLARMENRLRDKDEVAEVEMNLVFDRVRDKAKMGENLTDFETCMLIVSSEESTDKFLFRSSDAEFLRLLPVMKTYLGEIEFRDIITKVPNRLRRLKPNLSEVHS